MAATNAKERERRQSTTKQNAQRNEFDLNETEERKNLQIKSNFRSLFYRPKRRHPFCLAFIFWVFNFISFFGRIHSRNGSDHLYGQLNTDVMSRLLVSKIISRERRRQHKGTFGNQHWLAIVISSHDLSIAISVATVLTNLFLVWLETQTAARSKTNRTRVGKCSDWQSSWRRFCNMYSLWVRYVYGNRFIDAFDRKWWARAVQAFCRRITAK